jgi:hypothetical protein
MQRMLAVTNARLRNCVARIVQRIRRSRMTDLPVLVAGGGIGGLSVALTLQQIGVPCLVLEAVAELKPFGVGINPQPNAVRGLYASGPTDWMRSGCLRASGR